MAERTTCLLLPGTLCDARLYDELRAHWAEVAPTIEPLDVSLHGLGQDTATWWAERLQGLPERFDVLGFSLGGLLAFRLLALWPQRVRRLALVACNPQPATPGHGQRVREQRELWRTDGPLAVAEQMLMQAMPAGTVTAAQRERVLAMAASTPERAFLAQGELNATRPDGLPVLANSSGPLMLVSGAQDPWCGADKQALMRQARPDARWHELAGCGHYLPLVQGRALAELTASFFLSPSTGVLPS